MVRTGPDLTDDLLRETLELGLEKANCRFEKPVEIQAIAPTVFEELARLIGHGGMVGPPAVGEGLELRQLPTRGSTWEFRLPKASQMLRELTIEYRKAGARKYTARAAEEADRLTLIVPGSYAVQLLANDDPVRYVAQVVEVGEKPQEVKKDWPQSDRFFALTIRKFQGDQKVLFETLQDKRQLGNPLKNIEPVRNITFAFANLNSKAGKIGGPLMEGNVYLPQVPGIEEREPKRVWMYFPLTRDEAMKARDRYREFGTKSLPEHLRKEGKTVAYDDSATIDAGSEPRWFELLDRADGRGFTRQVPMKDFRQLAAKYRQGVWRLVVWEFDKGDPQAIAVQHPGDGRRVYVLEEEIKGLPGQMAERGDKEPKPPESKP
jgi:hypothetical protein